jgi:hypothetical protein
LEAVQTSDNSPALAAAKARNQMKEEQASAFQAGVPGARVIRLQNAGHDVFRSNEAEVLREINEFVSTLAKPDGSRPAVTPSANKRRPDTFNVPATANPYLAGMPRGTTARVGDAVPQQSPVFIDRTLSHAVAVTFSAVGATQHTPACPPHCNGPNGSEVTRHQGGAEHGLSDVVAPMSALLGVFLSDDQPDRSKPPRNLDFKAIQREQTVSPQLKQIFYIGDGRTRSGEPRRYLVPPKATRLYLGVMDGYEWNNNSGSFTVTVSIERDEVESDLFTVDSTISFSQWACLPDRAQCTPDRAIANRKAPGEFHVVLPASSEWGISVPDAQGTAAIHSVQGRVCLRPDVCVGPEGNGTPAGPGYLAEDKPVGALIHRRIEGRIYFSVNHRRGEPFRDHAGYFEFDVTTRE